MSKTARRTKNSAAHYKKHDVTDVVNNIRERTDNIRNRPASAIPGGQLKDILEAKFHSDNYPTFDKVTEGRRRIVRKERHAGKAFAHACVKDPEIAVTA